MEKSQTNVTLHAFENKQWRKFKQMSGEQMFYNQQPSQAGNLLRHPYLGANYTKLLWGRDLKLLGKLHNFPGHSLCLSQIWTQFTISRSFMCGINHLHMNSTQIKDQIFPSAQCVHWTVFFPFDRARWDLSSNLKPVMLLNIYLSQRTRSKGTLRKVDFREPQTLNL